MSCLMLGSLEWSQYAPARTGTTRRTELPLGSRPVPEPAKTPHSSSQGGANMLSAIQTNYACFRASLSNSEGLMRPSFPYPSTSGFWPTRP